MITKDITPFIQATKGGISAAAGKAGMTTLQSNPASSAADVDRQVFYGAALVLAATFSHLATKGRQPADQPDHDSRG